MGFLDFLFFMCIINRKAHLFFFLQPVIMRLPLNNQSFMFLSNFILDVAFVKMQVLII